MPSSIRWQLPISYGALALLTAVSLGGVLLFALRGYYTRQERNYLEQNAAAAVTLIEPLLNATQPFRDTSAAPLIQSQINTLSFLTQTKIQLLAPDGQVLADSGDPLDLQAITTLSLEVSTDDAMQTYRQTLDVADPDAISSLLIIDSDTGRFERATNVRGDFVGLGVPEGVIAPLSLVQTPASLGLGGLADPQLRSVQVLERPLGTPDGVSQGSVVLSQGPAFGRAILITVTWGLVLAGGVAVLLATLLGWLMSQRLNRPIQSLALATESIASGDLTVRAPIAGPVELRQLSQAFNVMALQVSGIIATLRQFVADAAHELNTPLTALRTNLDLAGKTEAENIHVARALNQAVRLQTLADNLLSLSRLESGLNGTAHQSVDLAAVLRERGESYAAQAEQAGLDFEIDLQASPKMIAGDLDLLSRAADNLIDNAIKFTPAGGRVALELSSENDWVVLHVRDTGIGVPAEDLELIFERFHRGRNAAETEGSGLGLAITRQIIHLHGGTITAQKLETGTAFTVRLPLARTPVSDR